MTGTAHAAPPQRIMSINLCADALVLALVPPNRITSVTFLARQSTDPVLAVEARAVGVNHGAAEEVLAQHPDLVIASVSAGPGVRVLTRRAGVRLIELPATNNFADVRAVTRQVGQAVGEGARAEALIAGMDATLAQLARTGPRRRIRVAQWDGGGFSEGRGTLFDAILTAAGGANVAADLPAAQAGALDVEQVLAARPEVLAQGDEGSRAPSLRGMASAHPALRRLYAGRRRVTYPELPFSCGTPASAQAAKELRAALLAATSSGNGR